MQVNIYEAKSNLSRLLERVQAGERVVIAKAGKPIADLVPHQRNSIRFGGLKGQIKYDDKDFEEADAEILAMFDPDLDVEGPRASS